MKQLISYIIFSLLIFAANAQTITVATLGLKAPLVNDCTPIKDQAMSGTCWSFASMSFLESEFLKNTGNKIDLSEMFIARYSYIRKIEKHLQQKGKTFFTPGGQFHDVVWVLNNYGIVPETKYTGRVSGEIWHNHAELDTAFAHYVNELLSNKIYKLTKVEYTFIDSVLDKHLGKVPTLFEYDGKQYSPKGFLKDYLQLNTNDFVEITSYTHHPFYTKFILEDKYNWTSDAYYNVPIADIFTITNNALKSGYTIGWGGDVDDSTFLYEKGLAYLPTTISNYQKERQQTFTDTTTDIDHLMHIVATTKDKFGKNWFYVKNSWGNYSNNLKGFLFMSADYFAIKTSAIIVNKKNIPSTIRKKLGI
jgi:bleomycin hydrolase